MSAEYLGSTTVSDHDVTLTITGDTSSLRPRLVEAVEKLGYKVIAEQPIQGKRGAECGARWGCSFEVLDYPTRLTISLKQINEIAVVAIFNYEVKSYHSMTKGDRQTLLREAETIAALASERLSISACRACATPVVDDSNFCRRCGAPLTVEVPEREVLRLTRKSRTAYHNMVIGVVILSVAILLLTPLFWVDAKVFKILLLMGSVGGAFGLIALLQGVWQLHFALNPKAAAVVVRPQPVLAASITTSLHQPLRGSITEGTTELLISNIRTSEGREAELLPRKVLDTGEVDDERLM